MERYLTSIKDFKALKTELCNSVEDESEVIIYPPKFFPISIFLDIDEDDNVTGYSYGPPRSSWSDPGWCGSRYFDFLE